MLGFQKLQIPPGNRGKFYYPKAYIKEESKILNVILRTPKWEDLDELLELINSLVDEGAEISKNKIVSREEEINWLAGLIARVEKSETFFLVADVAGKVVASSDATLRTGYESHVGGMGIVVKRSYRDVGIGT